MRRHTYAVGAPVTATAVAPSCGSGTEPVPAPFTLRARP
jgi:hypothetical protein